jgi:hypothetical protein
MKPRDRKIRRIAAVQARMHRLAQWELMECSAKEHELKERQRRIIEGFNGDSGLPELAAQTASRNLRAASVEQGVLAKAKERLASHALTEARKLKQVVRMASALARRALREQDKRLLEEVAETAAGRPRRGVDTDDANSDR